MGMDHEGQPPDEITFSMVTTKGGDKGKTSLYDGTRVSKDDILINFLGTMDTFTSFLGLAKAKTRNLPPGAFTLQGKFIAFLGDIQRKIIVLNGIAASPNNKKPPKRLDEDDIRFIEVFEKGLLEKTALKPQFILQGKSEVSAVFDIARTYCRQAERAAVSLIGQAQRDDMQTPQKFLNRLADAIYIMARYIDQELKATEL